MDESVTVSTAANRIRPTSSRRRRAVNSWVGAVEPVTLQGRAVDQRSRGVHAGVQPEQVPGISWSPAGTTDGM